MLKKVICLFTFISLAVLYSCNDSEESIAKQSDPLTADFAKSPVFNEFSQNFPTEYANLVYSKSSIQPIDEKNSLIVIPVEVNGKEIGTLFGMTLPKGGYQLIYQNLSAFSSTGKGVIELYTSKKNFIVDFNTTAKSGKVNYKINHIGKSGKTMLIKRTKGSAIGRFENGMPDPNDPWWTCTTDCYDFLSDNCGADPSCNMQCDLLNTCAVSFAAACGIYCF